MPSSLCTACCMIVLLDWMEASGGTTFLIRIEYLGSATISHWMADIVIRTEQIISVEVVRRVTQNWI